MTFRVVLVAAMVLASVSVTPPARAAEEVSPISVTNTDWAWWRGPNRNGVADANQTPPTEWDSEKNVLWKTPVPGRGYSSPTVVGDRVYLATADEAAEVQSVLCFDRKTGATIWKTDVHKGGFKSRGRDGHVRASKASNTIACDGHRLFINFLNDSAVHLTALDLEGHQLWQQKVTDYEVWQGYGSSPVLYGPLVIVAADTKAGGAVAAFDRVTGEPKWTHKRPENPNYASPTILNVDGRDQLLLMGCNLVSSFDPMTGAVNWEIEGATSECVTTIVSDGSLVLTSGGYPSKHISAVRGDGSGETVWRNETLVYVPSMLVHDGYLYVVNDSGDVLCYAVASGELKWENRIRGKFAASPTLVGDRIYATCDEGKTYIFKANPEAFELLGENQLEADEVQATPAICGDHIYMRLTRGKGEARQEMLYCLGS